MIIEGRLGLALMKTGIIPEHQDLIAEKLAQSISLETGVDGKRALKVTGAENIDDLVQQAQKQWPGAFYAPFGGVAGGGTSTRQPSDSTGGPTMSRNEFDRIGPETQAARMRAGWRLTE